MFFIFLLALILFGPKKLPEIGRQIGKFMAEFKRASNDFTSQLQTEIESAGADLGQAKQLGAQQSSSFTQTLLPPVVTSAISELDSAHDRLMQTARMAFDAQSFTLRPPQTPVVASTALEAAPVVLPAPQSSAPELSSSSQTYPETSLVEAATDHPTPDPAPAKSDSAPQSS